MTPLASKNHLTQNKQNRNKQLKSDLNGMSDNKTLITLRARPFATTLNNCKDILVNCRSKTNFFWKLHLRQLNELLL
jgi:hypothetical protein